MTAIARGRTKTQNFVSIQRSLPMAASETIYQGTIVMVNTSGYARAGATAASCIGVGVAIDYSGLDQFDNSSGSNGDITVEFEEGIFGPFENSSTSIAVGDEGEPCYIVDNQTVHRTSNSGARSVAGIIRKVDSSGVYVEFSAAIAGRIAATATTLTDNTGGSTAAFTLAALTDTSLYDNSGTIEDNFARIAAQVNILIAKLS